MTSTPIPAAMPFFYLQQSWKCTICPVGETQTYIHSVLQEAKSSLPSPHFMSGKWCRGNAEVPSPHVLQSWPEAGTTDFFSWYTVVSVCILYKVWDYFFLVVNYQNLIDLNTWGVPEVCRDLQFVCGWLYCTVCSGMAQMPVTLPQDTAMLLFGICWM